MNKGEAGQTAERVLRLEAINRNQMVMRVVDVERLVAEDHPVRAIWARVGRLDLSSFYAKIESVDGVAGRPAWDPRLLMSLWIYAYSQGVSSAREMGRLSEYDPAYQWLTGMKEVNYHTLSDFRVAHKGALEELFIQVLAVMSSEGLITLERVMHDGTKIRACASADTFRREDKIQKHLALAREHLKQIEEAGEEEVSARLAKARERAAREKLESLELALKELEKVRADKSGQEEVEKARVSMTDPEARIMKQSEGGFAPSYNVEISTDATAGVIVGVEATQAGSDYQQLVPAVDKIEENMGRPPEEMVTDGGFVSRENILAMHERGINFIGSMGDGKNQSAGQMNRRGVAEEFHPEAFSYDAASDTFTCPAGKLLHYEDKEERPGRTNHRYRAQASNCRVCPFRDKCCPTNATKGRTIVRGVDHPVVAAFINKMQTEEAKKIYRKRGAVAEFPNAWVKSKIGLRQFRMRGLIKAGIEALWACLTYNVQQWIRLSWRPMLAN